LPPARRMQPGAGVLVIYTFGVFASAMASDFGWSRAAHANALTIFLLCSGTGSLLLGPLIDRYGVRLPLCCVGGCIWSECRVPVICACESVDRLCVVCGHRSIRLCGDGDAVCSGRSWIVRRSSRDRSGTRQFWKRAWLGHRALLCGRSVVVVRLARWLPQRRFGSPRPGTGPCSFSSETQHTLLEPGDCTLARASGGTSSGAAAFG